MLWIRPNTRSSVSKLFRFGLCNYRCSKTASPVLLSQCDNDLKLSFTQFQRIFVRKYHAVQSLQQQNCRRLAEKYLKTLLYSRNQGAHRPPPERKPDDDDDEPDDDKPDDKKNRDKTLTWIKMITVLQVAVFVTYLFATAVKKRKEETSIGLPPIISWQQFVHSLLSTGEVEKIVIVPEANSARIFVHEGAVVSGRKVTSRVFLLNLTDVHSFEEKLREAEKQLGVRPENGVPVVFDHLDTENAVFRFIIFVVIAIILIRAMYSISMSKMTDGMMKQFTKAKYTLIDPLAGEGRGVRFADIAGLKEAKQEVIEFVDYLKRPEHYSRLGAKVPKGALLLGPPGCGKTLLAKAVATEASVPFLTMNGTDFVELYGGLGASRVRNLFKEARKRAPCIIYIDEIDAVGRKRFSMSQGDADQTLNQLLVELDGMGSKEGIILLASTNRADILDKALMRPGRFDRHIPIDLPTYIERQEIFEQHLKGIVLEEAPSFYSKRLAQLTPGFSGADIANICNEAALHAARFQKKKVQLEDLDYAIDRVLCGAEKKNSSVSPGERQRIAYYHAGRALVGWMLENTDALLKVSIIHRPQGLGQLQTSMTERFLLTNKELFDRMAMYIAGRAAESLTFNQISTSSEADLRKVSDIAYKVVEVYGMDEEVGMVSFAKQSELEKPIYSRKLRGLIDFQSRKLIMQSYQVAENILKENQDKLKLIADALLEKETLKYDDICNLIGPPPHGHKKQVDEIDFGMTDTTSGSSPEPKESSSKEPRLDDVQAEKSSHM